MKKILLLGLIILMFSCNEKQSKKNNRAENQTKVSDNPVLGSQNNGDKELKKATLTPNNVMIFFEGGNFLMGSEYGLPQEQPVHEVSVKAFKIDKSPVTVAEFRIFVETTNYKTEAEKYGDSGVFNLDLQNWELLRGAFWQMPFGPSGPAAEDMHPVTHVSWNDANKYAEWAGKRLPTEAEWEYAARSGKNSENKFSWGNEVSINGKYFANTWQGELTSPEITDGYLFTCPVGTFGENEAGLTDMGGNVWQWCADNYKAYPRSKTAVNEDSNVKVIRSGSFFYDQYGEDSYSVSGRSMNSIETSLFNTGFRCALDAK